MQRKVQEANEPFDVRNKGGQTAIKVCRVAPGPKRRTGAYAFRYRIGGKERVIEKVSREKIVVEALRMARGIDAGLAQTGDLTAADMESYVHARAVLGPDDPPLHAIVAEWKSLRQAVGNAPLSEVAAVCKRSGRRNAANGGTSALVEDLSREFLAILEERSKHNPSTRNLEGFRADLPRFCAKFGKVPIAEISAGPIETWLRGLGVGTRRQDNIREKLVTWFRWARDQGHVDEDRKTEPEKVPRVYKRTTEVEYWRPAELRKFLEYVSEKWLPCLVLAAFAGLRISEIGRLDWSAFDSPARRLYVRPSVALKTRRGRRVRMEENLAVWLAWRMQPSGRL